LIPAPTSRSPIASGSSFLSLGFCFFELAGVELVLLFESELCVCVELAAGVCAALWLELGFEFWVPLEVVSDCWANVANGRRLSAPKQATSNLD
jgi:hypothetical protein